jgi:hypothetical protein
MNIFYLHPSPGKCARWHCDKHVVKMILETAQLLYTAHWVLAKDAGIQPALDTAPPPKTRPTEHGYISIRNAKHPSAIWTRESLQHYKWLCELGLALCVEFRHRFGDKAHSCEAHILWLYYHAPAQIPDKGWTQPPKAMPDQYKRSKNSVICYRIYYMEAKTALLKYTARHRPHWIQTSLSSSSAAIKSQIPIQ